MGIDDNKFLRVLCEGQLLISMTEIKFGEYNPVGQCSKQVIYLGDGIAIQSGDWVDCLFKIPTNTNTCLVALDHGDNG